jgi:hypothetical protein
MKTFFQGSASIKDKRFSRIDISVKRTEKKNFSHGGISTKKKYPSPGCGRLQTKKRKLFLPGYWIGHKKRMKLDADPQRKKKITAITGPCPFRQKKKASLPLEKRGGAMFPG